MFPVEKMCKVLEVSPGASYRWVIDPEGKVARKNEPVTQQIKELFYHFKQRYGSVRLTVELNKAGVDISRPTVAGMMGKMDLQARRKRRFKATTDSKHSYRIVPNKLKRNFSVARKAVVWVSDITYIRTLVGWLYLTVILDLFDRKVVGWSTSTNLSAAATVLPAWNMATANRPISKALVFHSDRGVQYACDEFGGLLEQHPLVTRSMSRKGDCWDNAVAESFFKSIKVEEVYSHTYATTRQAELAIFEYIEGFYNRNRRHSALDYLTIEEFEEKNRNLNNAA